MEAPVIIAITVVVLSMIAMVYYEINITLSIKIVESSQNLVRNGYYTVVLSQDL